MKRINSNGDETTVAEPVATTTPTQKRMALSAIKEVEVTGAEKIVLYASEGWGKSTWAANADAPVFLSSEEGLKGVRNALNEKPRAFPEAESWPEIFHAIDALRVEPHDYKTLVIDTADWTEHLCHKHIIERDGQDSIEAYGYGKGYVVAFEEWKKLLGPINALRKDRGMTVIFLAHAAVKTFNNPEGENYDRYEMKTDRRVSALLKEWADAVLFGIYDVAVDKKKGYGGDRKLYANHTAAWDAKNRYGITKPLPADFDAFWKKVVGGESK
jgi:hypothetical protein